MGLDFSTQQEIKRKIRISEIPEPLVLLHGDFGLRNILVKSDEDIFIIDPESLWGDRHFDVAHVENIKDLADVFLKGMVLPEEFEKYWKMHYQVNKIALETYKNNHPYKLDIKEFQLLKLLDYLRKIKYREEKTKEIAKLYSSADQNKFNQAVNLQRGLLVSLVSNAL